MPNSSETHSFQAEVSALLKLVTGSLYTNSEVFLRELVSNASDALDKARYQALVDDTLQGKEEVPEILITADKTKGILVIEDTGIGMTKEETAAHLGTIAHSGTLKYLAEAQASGKEVDLNLIGQFGVGFYSCFMVADRVDVHTLSAKSGSEPVCWSSAGQGEYSITPSQRNRRGTRIELYLKDSSKDFLESYRIREIVRRYSNYVMHPIKLQTIESPKESEETPESSKDPEQINAAAAIWTRSANELKDDDYTEFYKHIMGGFVLPGDEAMGRLHFSMDAPIQFHALLFVPGRAPADLFMEDRKALQLFARRILVDENSDKLLPQYLRFIRGVVDSQDLPLNVSRETLQDHSSLAAIRRQLTRKSLKLLADIAEESPEKYAKLWQEFGAVIKEGIHLDGGHRKELTDLVRWRSVEHGENLVKLEGYRKAMSDDQEYIYYIAGENEHALRTSPHIEIVRSKGYDVLLMTDAVDEWVLQSLSEYEGKKFRSVTQGDLEASEKDEASDSGDTSEKNEKDTPSTIDPLLGKAKEILGDKVSNVRASKRLTESAACLVDEEGGLSRNMQRILRMSQRNGGESQSWANKRVLELNPDHPFVVQSNALVGSAPDDPRLATWIEILHDLAGLAEGQVADPTAAVKRIQSVLVEATKP